jgi:hypothetical protein
MRKPCPFEDAVAAAARSGDWSPELRAHRDGCLSCAELTLVVAALTTDAELLMGATRPLPDPKVIWLRATLATREQQLDRATRAIVWVQRAALAAAAVVGIAFAPGLWGLVRRTFSEVALANPVAGLPRAAGSPLLVLVVSMTILGALALYELTAVREG